MASTPTHPLTLWDHAIIGVYVCSPSFHWISSAWANRPSITWIKMPDDAVDTLATVIKLEFDEPLELYSGIGETLKFHQ